MGVWWNWHTRTLQVRMGVIPWGFKSLHAHHLYKTHPAKAGLERNLIRVQARPVVTVYIRCLLLGLLSGHHLYKSYHDLYALNTTNIQYLTHEYLPYIKHINRKLIDKKPGLSYTVIKLISWEIKNSLQVRTKKVFFIFDLLIVPRPCGVGHQNFYWAIEEIPYKKFLMNIGSGVYICLALCCAR